MGIRLKQLAQDGATDTQVVTWNNGTSEWEPADAGGGDTRIAQSGIILDGCQFFIDFNNQSSWAPNQTTTWVDTVTDAVGTASATAIDAGHLNFNGSTSQVDFGVPSSGMLNPFTGGGGVGAWVRKETGTGVRFIVNTGSGVGFAWRVQDESGGLYRVRFAQQILATNKSFESDVVIPIDEWVFLSFSWDGDVAATNGQIFINGVAVTTTPAGAIAGAPEDGTVIGIGRNVDLGTGNFGGDIEMVMVYDTEPVASEWLDIFNATKGRFGFSYPGTWAETLVEGQLSGGTDAVMTPGDALRGVNTLVGKGGDVLIHGGDPVSGQGGDLTVRSGTSNDSAGSDGKIFVFAGDSSSISVTPTFDSLTLHGADRLVDGTAGGVVMRGGDASGGTAAGGAVAIRGGLGNQTGGALTVRSGGASAGGNITGDITISTDRDGTGDSDTNTGAIEISTTGSSTANVGGDISIAAGSSGNASGNRGGNISITCTDMGAAAVNSSGGKILLTAADFLGTNLVANLDSGGIILQAGSNVRTAAGAGTDAEGGPIRLLAGDSALPELQAAGGLIDIIAGDNSSSDADARGGPVTIISGSTLVGLPGIAGAITLTPGTNSDGTPGDLTFNYAHFPKTDGAAGEVLTTAGSGTPGSPSQMAWSAAAAATWEEVLTAGNFSGVNDAIISIGRFLRAGDTNAGGAPALLKIRGGNNASAFTTALGGAVTITGGSTNGVSPAVAGDVTIAGGPAIGTTSHGGNLFLNGGTSVGGRGGDVTISGAEGIGTGGGGNVSLIAGDGNVAQGEGGDVTIAAGDSFGGNTLAGRISITAGDKLSSGNGVGGPIDINAGNGSANGGEITIKAGDKTVSDGAETTGGILIETGDYTPATGATILGDITIRCTTPAAGTAVQKAGNVLIEASGSTLNFGINGGSVTINAGGANGSGPSHGGDFFLNGGAQTASGGDRGGDMTFTGGAVTHASNGNDGGGIALKPGTAAGAGSTGALQLSYVNIPVADGTAGQVLTTAGGGTQGTPSQASWSTPTTFATQLAYTTGAPKSGAYTAVAFEHVRVNTASIVISLPASPAADERVGVVATVATIGTYSVSGNGNTLVDPATSTLLATATVQLTYSSYVWKWDATDSVWRNE